MARTISTAIAGSLTLSLADPLATNGSDDPLTITSQGSVISSGPDSTPPPGVDAIVGPAGTAWVIVNQGTVSSSTASAIALAGGGTLRNAGLIASGTNGSINGLAPSDGFSANGPARVFNQGTIDGAGDDSNGVALYGGGEVANSGSITGAGESQSGVYIVGSGVVNNDAGGYIGGNLGVFIDGSSGIVTNRGVISGFGPLAVLLDDGGFVTNLAGGTISASKAGIVIGGQAGAVTNQGTIGGYDAGVTLLAGGQVANSAHAFMAGVDISGGVGNVINEGLVSASGGDGEPAVELDAGGVITNEGDIIGSPIGNGICIDVTGGSGTVTNAGTISGSESSIVFGVETTDNRLIIDPGAVFTGVVDNAGPNSSIELAPGKGQVSAIGGGLFNGFVTLVADHGAAWRLDGYNSIGTVQDNGVLDISGSLAVTQAADFGSAGVLQLVGASTLSIATSSAYEGKIGFAGGSELIIGNPGLFGQSFGNGQYLGPVLTDFAGSTIDLEQFGIKGLKADFSRATGLLHLTDAAGDTATLDFQTSSLGAGTFEFASDGLGGVLVTHPTSARMAPHVFDLWMHFAYAV